ncbi:hypothetical protein X777_01260 [Ooceraea biroi]|uniref:Uncharacterized protein n=1 Tax=Ooceraea biroi TaxID=2015173 RepID=A0A026WQS7_OOCBI|nr:hypothetical protein X777_01260 [Ooceraea biroi]
MWLAQRLGETLHYRRKIHKDEPFSGRSLTSRLVSWANVFVNATASLNQVCSVEDVNKPSQVKESANYCIAMRKCT